MYPDSMGLPAILMGLRGSPEEVGSAVRPRSTPDFAPKGDPALLMAAWGIPTESTSTSNRAPVMPGDLGDADGVAGIPRRTGSGNSSVDHGKAKLAWLMATQVKPSEGTDDATPLRKRARRRQKKREAAHNIWKSCQQSKKTWRT